MSCRCEKNSEAARSFLPHPLETEFGLADIVIGKRRATVLQERKYVTGCQGEVPRVGKTVRSVAISSGTADHDRKHLRARMPSMPAGRGHNM